MNIFKQLIKSIYSPKDIATFINQKMYKSILFLLLLAFITMIPATYFTSNTILDARNEIIHVLENEFPEFGIVAGQLKSNESAPIIYNGKKITYLFDSTNTLTSNDVNSPTTVGFLTDGIYYYSDGVQNIPYTPLGIRDSQELKTLLEPFTINNTLVYSIIALIAVLSTLLIFVILLIQSVLIALIGKLLAGFTKRTYKFSQMYKITPYTMTLSTVFFLIMDFLQVTVPFAAFTSLLVTVIVMYLTLVELAKLQDHDFIINNN